ncbi:Translin [Lipomyces kononenkoae]|uniref:Translin n=1 Tax=Lipomyces kononenkoae TaxID=34357 RepID=A0ACC3SU93_LIPKO
MDLDIFDKCQDSIDRDSQIRENIRTLTKAIEPHTRSILSVLSAAHSTPSIPNFATRTSESFQLQKEAIQSLASLASQHPFYKYNSIWSRTVQNAAFVTLFRDWLVNEGNAYIAYDSGSSKPEESDEPINTTQESDDVKYKAGQLTTIQCVCEALGGEFSGLFQEIIERTTCNYLITVKSGVDDENAFHLTLEEYLQATISLINELSRLAVNSVIMTENSNYSTPIRINHFIKQLQAGFLMLNLKNDSLRTRVDSIKYDVKKVEEVIYDLSLRGLIRK